MSLLQTVYGSKIGMIFPFPYWAVKMHNGRWISEVDNKQLVIDERIYSKTPIEQLIADGIEIPHIDKQVTRTYDWTMDLVTTGDVLNIKELWMLCPPSRISPQGNTATLHFKPEDAGCAFHFNVSHMTTEGRYNHKIIGKVTDRGTGDCVCFIWDDSLRAMSSPFYTNVNNFASWKPNVPGQSSAAPIGRLNHEVIGLRGVSENFYRP